jgi:hypothetical protein
MKTIGYLDRTEGKTIRLFNPDYKKTIPYQLPLGCLTRQERIIAGLKELKHMGNIEIYLIKGNKQRLLFKKGI